MDATALPDPCVDVPQGRPAREGPCCVLLVDDDASFLQDMSDLLATYMAPLHIVTAGSGGQGLEVLGGQAVDLIISDQNMPGMNGLEFLDAARVCAPGVPRILMTGDPRYHQATDALRDKRVCEIIPKPPHSTLTVQTVRRFLRGRCTETPGQGPPTAA